MLEGLTDILRRLAGTRLLLPTTALVLRARCVRESAAFLARELCGRRGAFSYTLRDGGRAVVLRHQTGDVVTLGELFHNGDYEPPAEVGAPRRVLDLGANIGLFGAFAKTRWPDADLLAYEPDPINVAVQRATMAAQADGGWELRPVAAGAHAGSLRFAVGLDALSHALDHGEMAEHVIEVPVDDVLPLVCESDVVKLDIEGGEWALVGDPRFAASPPRAIVLEYHPRGCPDADPHTAIRAALARAAMQHRDIWRRDDGHGMLWAWRT